MSEQLHLDDEPRISDFGMVGVIQLAGEAAMAHYKTTPSELAEPRNAALAQEVNYQYMAMIHGFAERNPAETWNDQSEADLRHDFAAYVTEAGIGEL